MSAGTEEAGAPPLAMDAGEIARRLQASGLSDPRAEAPETSSEQQIAVRVRGDHDFDPDLKPSGPLTPAAVLIPIVRRESGLTVMLTKRTDHLRDHAGQVSFPGGRIDPGDADAPAAALRETEEEVRLDPARIELVGRLDTYLTRTGFRITPVVGLVTPPFELRLDAFEVAEAFETPLSFLLDRRNHAIHSLFYKGRDRRFFAMEYDGYYIWGATAGMVVNLADTLLDPMPAQT